VSELWSVLGYDDVAGKIATAFHAGTPICLIEGPPGVGKSWLAKDVGALWESRGGSTVVAEGDSLKGDASFYPFGFAMGNLPSGWGTFRTALGGMTRAGEALLGTAGLITATVEAAAQARKARKRERAMFLGDTEQAILYELERSAKKGPLLFIADNLHWWDRASLDFLGQVRSPRMWDAFPFLAELRVLAVQTPEPYQSIADPEAHEALLSPSSTSTFALQRIPREGFERVLTALGAPSPSSEVTDIVHSLSGGHLALASRCADQIAQGESDIFLTMSDREEFLRTLLSERIRSLGQLGKQAVETLKVAAVLGLAFRHDEVTCASGRDKAEIARILRQCRGEGVLQVAEGLDRFVHDLYRQHFLMLGTEDRRRIHEGLADCLRLLRPAEYELRCLNAIDAEQSREAAALAVHAGLQRVRDGRAWGELPDRVLAALEDQGWTHVLERFVLARTHLDNYEFSECLNTLDGLPRDLPKSLLAETDYLRAMCLMSTRSEDDRAEGRSTLSAWSGYEEEEPELGMRLMQLLLYGLAKLLDKEDGRRLEGRIRQFLAERVAYDIAAKDALYTLDRCSASLYQPDISIIRKGEAVAYYRPTENAGVVRRPVEYYRCLVNYCAGLISNARYVEASEVHQNIEKLVSEYAPDTFPRLDFPQMNGLLADYRLGVVGADEAVGRQRAIVDALQATRDPFYAKNAMAVYLTLAGTYAEALDVFNDLDVELTCTRNDPEPNMLYLIRANRAAARFLAGDASTARAEWTALDDIVGKNAYMFRQLLLRRHDLLGEMMAKVDPATTSAREFDTCLIERNRHEFGPLWNNFARGFRMPEVEFWREN
jgi:hypothetical protein